jgi:cyclic beta-1,2-glucan synthetase
MYRLLVETLLGIKLEGDRLRLIPRLPKHWPTCKISYRYRQTIYRIEISRVANGSSDAGQIFLDGGEMADGVIPLVDDQREHLVDMRLQ